MFMNKSTFTARTRWLAAAFVAVCAMLPCVDSLRAQNYSVTPARPATIESIRQVVEHKNSPSNPLGMIAGGLIGWWLLITTPFVVMGVYWLAVPLPLEELHQRTLRAGRAPTAAETTAAVLGACTGKAAWQHRIMQRKADAFAKNLNNIAQHL